MSDEFSKGDEVAWKSHGGEAIGRAVHRPSALHGTWPCPR